MIMFTENRVDYIQVLKDGQSSEYWGQEKYSGPFSDGNYPSIDAPMVIPSGRFQIRFITDSSRTEWGYKLVVWEPTTEELQCAAKTSEYLMALEFDRNCVRDNVQVYESSHPYEDNANQRIEVHDNSVQAWLIAFSPQTITEPNYDFIRFLHMNESESGQFWGSNKYSGPWSMASYPTLDNPLFVNDSGFSILFKSDGSNVRWGWKIVVWPAAQSDIDAEAAQQRIVEEQAQRTMSIGRYIRIQSHHEYSNNVNVDHGFRVLRSDGSTATHTGIVFHTNSKTEPNHDFVSFFCDSNKTRRCGAEKYCGGRNGTDSNWPGVNGAPPLIIPTGDVFVHFKTDTSNSDWGFEFIAYDASNDPSIAEWDPTRTITCTISSGI